MSHSYTVRLAAARVTMGRLVHAPRSDLLGAVSRRHVHEGTGYADHQDRNNDAQQDDPDDPPRVALGARRHARHLAFRVPGGGGLCHARSIGGVGSAIC